MRIESHVIPNITIIQVPDADGIWYPSGTHLVPTRYPSGIHQVSIRYPSGTHLGKEPSGTHLLLTVTPSTNPVPIRYQSGTNPDITLDIARTQTPTQTIF